MNARMGASRLAKMDDRVRAELKEMEQLREETKKTLERSEASIVALRRLRDEIQTVRVRQIVGDTE
jgi:hypothetical protein